jgi:hypothetical protein
LKGIESTELSALLELAKRTIVNVDKTVSNAKSLVTNANGLITSVAGNLNATLDKTKLASTAGHHDCAPTDRPGGS